MAVPQQSGTFSVTHVPIEPFWAGGQVVSSEVWRRFFDNLYAKVGGATSIIVTTDALIAGPGISLVVNNTAKTITVSNTGVRSVNVDGGSTGLTFSGGPITSTGVLTLGGTLGIVSGGTGGNTRKDALNNLLPSQVGTAGQFLQSDGVTANWQSVGNDSITPTQLLAYRAMGI